MTEQATGALTWSVPRLTADAAMALVHAAIREVRTQGHPAAIAVVSDTGQEILTYCMDGAAPQAPQVARNKAFTAATYRMPSDEFLEHTRTFGPDGAAMLTAAVDHIMLLGGGVPVTIENMTVGAVGISGGSGKEDRAAATAAITTVLHGTEPHGAAPNTPTQDTPA